RSASPPRTLARRGSSSRPRPITPIRSLPPTRRSCTRRWTGYGANPRGSKIRGTMPSTTSAGKRISELRKELDHHNHLYYVESRPSISDRDYARLMQELIDLERANPELITPDSPSQRVGGEVQTELKSVRHAVPMMSIDNTYNEAEVRAFDERVGKA